MSVTPSSSARRIVSRARSASFSWRTDIGIAPSPIALTCRVPIVRVIMAPTLGAARWGAGRDR